MRNSPLSYTDPTGYGTASQGCEGVLPCTPVYHSGWVSTAWTNPAAAQENTATRPITVTLEGGLETVLANGSRYPGLVQSVPALGQPFGDIRVPLPGDAAGASRAAPELDQVLVTAKPQSPNPPPLDPCNEEAGGGLVEWADLFGSVSQVFAGAGACSTIVGCAAGAPLVLLGLNGVQESLTGGPGFLRNAATYYAGETAGSVAVDAASIAGSGVGLTVRTALKPGTWKLWRHVSSDYQAAYRGMTKVGLGVEMVTSTAGIANTMCRYKN